jgi:putative sporulation protein YyaC
MYKMQLNTSEVFTANIYSANAKSDISRAICNFIGDEPPVFMCIGTDKVTGDSLGPLVGHLLTRRHNVNAFVYGTLSAPITAKNLILSDIFIRTVHPTSKMIAVDAALGNGCDIGLVKMYEGGVMPGSATNKNLPRVGDISIMGIVNAAGMADYVTLNSTRLNLVYKMAELIAAAVADGVIVAEAARAGRAC